MPASQMLPELRVEGSDDYHTIRHIISRHGISLEELDRRVNLVPVSGRDSLLEAISTAVQASSNKTIGFVIDADQSCSRTWQSVSSRLGKSPISMNLPTIPPPDGFIDYAQSLKARVGIWIMPDNSSYTGTLENFLEALVPRGDKLLQHARTATDEAKDNLEAEFPENDRLKATIHTWLAWQKEPGRPYGTAIKANYFSVDGDLAGRFVKWFKTLYELG